MLFESPETDRGPKQQVPNVRSGVSGMSDARNNQGESTRGNENSADSLAVAPGGARSNLSMANAKDRAALREAIKRWPKRWRGLTDEFKAECVDGLREAMRVARHEGDANAIAGIVRTAAMIEGQNQADEHLLEKYERIDNGQATDKVENELTILPPPVIRSESA